MNRQLTLWIFTLALFSATALSAQQDVFDRPYETLSFAADSTFIFEGIKENQYLEDIDGNGTADLLYRLSSASSVTVEWNDGMSFTPETLVSDTTLGEMVLASVTNPGARDVVYSLAGGILYRTYSGGQMLPAEFFMPGRLISAVDLNADELSDFAIQRGDSLMLAISVAPMDYDLVHLGSVDPAFQVGPDDIAVGDLDSSGTADVVLIEPVTPMFNYRVLVWFDQGDFNFVPGDTSILDELVDDNGCSPELRFRSVTALDLDRNTVPEMVLHLEIFDFCYCDGYTKSTAFRWSVETGWAPSFDIPELGLFERINELIWVERPDGYLALFTYATFSFYQPELGIFDTRTRNLLDVLDGGNYHLVIGELDGRESMIAERYTLRNELPTLERIALPLEDGIPALRHHHPVQDQALLIPGFGTLVSAVHLDGDLRPDLLSIGSPGPLIDGISSDSMPVITAYLNDGAGSFQAQRLEVSADPEGPVTWGTHHFAGTIDLDGDRISELVMLRVMEHDQSQVTAVILYERNGQGEYGVRQRIELPGVPPAAAVADADGDGLEDLAMNDILYRNNGAGMLEPHSMDVLPRVADLNGDGLTDFYVADRDSMIMRLRLNNGDGTTSASSISYPRELSEIYFMTDLNADGLADVAGFSPSGWDGGYCYTETYQYMYFMYQTDSMTLGLGYTEELYVEDVFHGLIPNHSLLHFPQDTGDSKLILYSVNYGWKEFLGDSAYNFGPSVNGEVTLGLVPVELADMDLDGDLDLVTYNSGYVGYLENTRISSPVSAADEVNQPGNFEYRIWPNPVRSGGTIRLQGVPEAPASIQCIDLQGRLVFQTKSPTLRQPVRLPDASPGYYLLRITDGNGITGIAPFIIQ